MTLGQLFQSKRQESGRSLEQLAALTKIHIKILRALETDTYTDLPARAFTRGFIVNYAKALKLDPEQVLAEHKEFLEQKFSERQDRDLGHQGYVFEGKEIEQTRRWMVIGASIAVVFAAATIFIFKPANHRHKEQHKDFEEEATMSADDSPADGSASPHISPSMVSATANVSSTASPNELLGDAITGTATPVSAVKASLSATPAATVVETEVPAVTSAQPTATKPTATPKPAATPKPSATPTPKPTQTPKPSPTPKEATEPKPSPSPGSEAEASPSPALKEDKLLKGDDLDPKAVKLKITFQAVDDVWVRYKSDKKDSNVIILRKGRLLVIKATDRLLFEGSNMEALTYKVKGAFTPLTIKKGELGPHSSLQPYEGSDLGTRPLPESVPPSPQN